MRSPPAAATVLRLLAAALAAAVTGGCPSSPGRLDPPTASTSVTVPPHTLDPASTVFYAADGITLVMVTDHPAACAEVSALPACQPASWAFFRGQLDPPASVRTALVIYLNDRRVGTYPTSAVCGREIGPGYPPSSHASFIVRGAGGEIVARDVALTGHVALWSLETPGRGASGTYDLQLTSGQAIQGAFAGAFCAELAGVASFPLGWNLSYGYGPDSSTEACDCGGAHASSSCDRAPGGDWTCQCTAPDGAMSSCQLPSGATVPSCLERWFTCCPMCP